VIPIIIIAISLGNPLFLQHTFCGNTAPSGTLELFEFKLQPFLHWSQVYFVDSRDVNAHQKIEENRNYYIYQHNHIERQERQNSQPRLTVR